MGDNNIPVEVVENDSPVWYVTQEERVSRLVVMEEYDLPDGGMVGRANETLYVSYDGENMLFSELLEVNRHARAASVFVLPGQLGTVRDQMRGVLSSRPAFERPLYRYFIDALEQYEQDFFREH